MPAIGIDLGTTNSVVGWCVDGDVEIIENRDGQRKTPSVIHRIDSGFVVGEQAVNQRVTDPNRTITSIKRYIGRKEPIVLGDEEFSAAELSSRILEYLKSSTEQQLETDLTDVVITVPAYFNHPQRIAVREAAELAGLSVSRILNEPTAACIAYGLQEASSDSTILVYDLGGGTFDVSVVKINDSVFDVLGTDGDDQLGGDDWDGFIVQWIIEAIEAGYDVSVPDPLPLSVEERLFEAAQDAKHELSTRQKTTIRLPYLELNEETITVEVSLHRDTFEAITEQLLDRTIDRTHSVIDQVLDDGNTVDDILLVGGATRMPMVQETIETELGISPKSTVNPDEAVARGAAIQAALLAEKNLPAKQTHSDVPSELGGEEDNILLLDSTPKYIGLKTKDKTRDEFHFSTIISQNETIPTKNTREYQTIKDNQRYIDIEILESRTATLDDTTLIEQFRLGPVPERPAGETKIEATIILTEDGTIIAEISETEGFVEEQVTIESAVQQSKEELAETKRDLPAVKNT